MTKEEIKRFVETGFRKLNKITFKVCELIHSGWTDADIRCQFPTFYFYQNRLINDYRLQFDREQIKIRPVLKRIAIEDWMHESAKTLVEWINNVIIDDDVRKGWDGFIVLVHQIHIKVFFAAKAIYEIIPTCILRFLIFCVICYLFCFLSITNVFCVSVHTNICVQTTQF